MSSKWRVPRGSEVIYRHRGPPIEEFSNFVSNLFGWPDDSKRHASPALLAERFMRPQVTEFIQKNEIILGLSRLGQNSIVQRCGEDLSSLEVVELNDDGNIFEPKRIAAACPKGLGQNPILEFRVDAKHHGEQIVWVRSSSGFAVLEYSPKFGLSIGIEFETPPDDSIIGMCASRYDFGVGALLSSKRRLIVWDMLTGTATTKMSMASAQTSMDREAADAPVVAPTRDAYGRLRREVFQCVTWGSHPKSIFVGGAGLWSVDLRDKSTFPHMPALDKGCLVGTEPFWRDASNVDHPEKIENSFSSLCMHPVNGNILAGTSSADSSIYIWDTRNLTVPIFDIPLPPANEILGRFRDVQWHVMKDETFLSAFSWACPNLVIVPFGKLSSPKSNPWDILDAPKSGFNFKPSQVILAPVSNFSAASDRNYYTPKSNFVDDGFVAQQTFHGLSGGCILERPRGRVVVLGLTTCGRLTATPLLRVGEEVLQDAYRTHEQLKPNADSLDFEFPKRNKKFGKSIDVDLLMNLSTPSTLDERDDLEGSWIAATQSLDAYRIYSSNEPLDLPVPSGTPLCCCGTIVDGTVGTSQSHLLPSCTFDQNCSGRSLIRSPKGPMEIETTPKRSMHVGFKIWDKQREALESCWTIQEAGESRGRSQGLPKVVDLRAQDERRRVADELDSQLLMSLTQSTFGTLTQDSYGQADYD